MRLLTKLTNKLTDTFISQIELGNFIDLVIIIIRYKITNIRQ